jgi:hypothetical protein
MGVQREDGTSDVVQDTYPTYYSVSISKVMNGFLVQVGCARFVSHKWKEVCEAIEFYWKDPVAAQDKYYNKEV